LRHPFSIQNAHLASTASHHPPILSGPQDHCAKAIRIGPCLTHLLPLVCPFHPPPSSAQGGPRAPSHLKPSEVAGSDLGVVPHTCSASLCAPGSTHSGACEGAALSPIQGHGAAKQTKVAGSDLGAVAQACGASLCTPGSRLFLCGGACPGIESEHLVVLTPQIHRARCSSHTSGLCALPTLIFILSYLFKVGFELRFLTRPTGLRGQLRSRSL
jgi:hypothetical protein